MDLPAQSTRLPSYTCYKERPEYNHKNDEHYQSKYKTKKTRHPMRITP